jgi:hypothetical protein
VKGKQIVEFYERSRETNHLVKGLQDSVLQLQAPAAPEVGGTYHEVDPLEKGKGGNPQLPPKEETAE